MQLYADDSKPRSFLHNGRYYRIVKSACHAWPYFVRREQVTIGRYLTHAEAVNAVKSTTD